MEISIGYELIAGLTPGAEPFAVTADDTGTRDRSASVSPKPNSLIQKMYRSHDQLATAGPQARCSLMIASETRPARYGSFGGSGVWRRRISPSWTVEATRVPSQLKMLPRENPRELTAVGLSNTYNSHSSTRTGRWNHMA